MAQYFAALGYRFWVKLGTTGSTPPTSSSGMTEVLSLTNAGIQSQSDTQEVLDYGSSLGWKTQLVTGQSYTIPMAMNLDLRDPGYAILRQAALESAAGTAVEWYRESPEMSATGSPEKNAGVALITDFSESIEAGQVATVSFTLTGIGAPLWTAETDA